MVSRDAGPNWSPGYLRRRMSVMPLARTRRQILTYHTSDGRVVKSPFGTVCAVLLPLQCLAYHTRDGRVSRGRLNRPDGFIRHLQLLKATKQPVQTIIQPKGTNFKMLTCRKRNGNLCRTPRWVYPQRRVWTQQAYYTGMDELDPRCVLPRK